MSNSLADRLRALEVDLVNDRHYTYADLPFAAFCYTPREEWALRREAALLRTRLEGDHGFSVARISLADLLWRAIDETEGMAEMMRYESRRGFAAAQSQVQFLLTEAAYRPLPGLLGQALAEARRAAPAGRHPLGFIERAGALAPAVYRASKLLDEMKGETTPCVLFLPATSDGLNVRFMGVAENEPRGSYHTRVYAP